MPAKQIVKKAKLTERGSSQDKAPQQNGAIDFTKKATFNEDIWHSFAAGVLRSKHRIALDGDYSTDPAYTEALDMFEIENAKLAKDYPSAIVAGQAFDEWLDRTEWVYEAPILFMATGFHVSLTVPVSSGSITVGMDYSSVGEEADVSLRAAFDFLQATVKATFPGQKTAIQANVSKPQAEEPETVTEHSTLLVAQEYNGKVVYRVVPDEGKWQEFGIPLYPDIAKKFGVTLPQDIGEYEVNWHVEYQLKDDGRPKRVVKIEEAS